MISSKEKTALLSVIDSLTLPDTFGYDDIEFDPLKLEQELSKFGYGRCMIKGGMSKIAIIFENLSYVIKTSYDGEWECDYNEDDENFGETFYPYAGFQNKNYCRDEYDTINFFIEEGYGDLTPDTFFLCTKNNREFFAQEKVIVAADYLYDDYVKKINPSKESLQYVRNNFRGKTTLRPAWLAKVVDIYGEDFVNDFFKWGNEYAYETIRDLHHNNYGSRADGSPVIIDFGGFNE